MNLSKWNPFREMETFFENYPSNFGTRSEVSRMFNNWTPTVDITETPEEFLIKAELPAVKKDDINLQIDNGILTLTGERNFEKEDDNKKHHRVERFFGNFSRSFVLPDTVNSQHIRADFKDGLLTISLLKSEPEAPKSVKIDIR